MATIQYRTFEVAIANNANGLKFIEVVAIDAADALAQIEEAFFNARVVTYRQIA